MEFGDGGRYMLKTIWLLKWGGGHFGNGINM